MNGRQGTVECPRSTKGPSMQMETRNVEGSVAIGRLPALKEKGSHRSEIRWPKVSEANATLHMPSFVKIDPLECHGGSISQRKRGTRESVREKQYPIKHVSKSKQVDLPLVEKAHQLRGVLGAVQFLAGNGSNALKFFWGRQIEALKRKASRCRRATM